MSAIVPEFRVLDSRAARTVFEVLFSPRWAVSWMFGGAIAAVLAKAAVLSGVDHDLVPVTTDVRFLAPTAPGLALVVVTQLSTGSNYSTARVSVNIGGTTTASALVTLAARTRLAWIASGGDEDAPTPSSGTGAVEARVDWRAPSHWAERDGTQSPSPFAARIGVRDALFTDGRDDTAYRYLVASDLLAPPLVTRQRPLSVATVSLQLTTVALTDASWVTQNLQASEHEGDAVGHLTLSTPTGGLLAHAVQRAAVRAVDAAQLPFSATGFGWGTS